MDDIEITIRRTGNVVEVIHGDKTTGQLCMGECIEQVIGLVYPGANKTYPMHTPDDWRARFKKTTNAPEG